MSLSGLSGYEISKQKLIVFQYTSSEHVELKNKNLIILFIITWEKNEMYKSNKT